MDLPAIARCQRRGLQRHHESRDNVVVDICEVSMHDDVDIHDVDFLDDADMHVADIHDDVDMQKRRMQPARGHFARFDLDRQMASTLPAHWKVGPALVFLGQPATGTRRVAVTTHTESGRR